MIFQAENNECGLACVAMISSYYGSALDLQTIRSRFGASILGSSAKQLMSLAAQLNLRGRALKFEINDLKGIKLPAIMHWDLDHFVILKELNRNTATIYDPAVGIKKYSVDELNYHLTGIAIEFTPTANFKKNIQTSSIKLIKLFDGVDLTRASLARIFIMTLLIQLLALLSPLYLQLVVDQGLVKGDSEFVLMLGLVFVAVVLLKTTITHLRGMYLLQYGNSISFQLLSNSAHHLLNLPIEFFSRREMGDIVSRFGSLENIRKLVTQEMVTVVVDGLFSIITLILLFVYSPTLAGVVLLIVMFVTCIRFACIDHEQTLRKTALVTSAKQQTKFMENVRSVSTSKVNCIELARLSEWENDLVKQLNSGYRLESFLVSLGTYQSVLLGIENIAVIYLGAGAVISGGFTLGQLMSFIFLKQHFTSSVLAMLPKLSEIKMLNLELERVSDILNSPLENTDEENHLLTCSIDSEMQFRDASIFFPGTSTQLISDINLKVKQGDAIAVTGNSGCGKSTFLRALLKLDVDYGGNISIGSRELKSISRYELRSQVSAVLHDDGLLSGDLAYNIHLGVDPGNQEKLSKICNDLGLNELIESLPLGLCTGVGELGNILSAGQIQRILLARALYRSPKLLLLDEALSHLNREAAHTILRALKATGCTIILVTHDRDLVARMDCELNLTEHVQCRKTNITM